MYLYSLQAVENAVNEMINEGAEVFTIPGALLDAYVVFPTEKHTGFIAKEKYLNEWSSAYTVRRFTKISKRISEIAEAVEAENYELAENLLYA